jgi:hypothetical protein
MGKRLERWRALAWMLRRSSGKERGLLGEREVGRERLTGEGLANLGTSDNL